MFGKALLLVALSAAPVLAQASRDSIRDDRRFSFYDRGPYRPAVPRPETILGYDIGEANTQFAQQERVLLAIADAAKDRVRVEEIGSTNERRTMRLFIVSAPENIQRLDAIRADLDRLADPRGATAAELDAIVERTAGSRLDQRVRARQRVARLRDRDADAVSARRERGARDA